MGSFGNVTIIVRESIVALTLARHLGVALEGYEKQIPVNNDCWVFLRQ